MRFCNISFLFGINYRLIMPLLFIGYLIAVIIPNQKYCEKKHIKRENVLYNIRKYFKVI